MRTNHSLVALLLASMAACGALAQDATSSAEAKSEADAQAAGAMLKAAYKDHFLVGVAINRSIATGAAGRRGRLRGHLGDSVPIHAGLMGAVPCCFAGSAAPLSGGYHEPGWPLSGGRGHVRLSFRFCAAERPSVRPGRPPGVSFRNKRRSAVVEAQEPGEGDPRIGTQRRAERSARERRRSAVVITNQDGPYLAASGPSGCRSDSAPLSGDQDDGVGRLADPRGLPGASPDSHPSDALHRRRLSCSPDSHPSGVWRSESRSTAAAQSPCLRPCESGD